MKKSLSLVLIGVLVGSSATFASVRMFSDLPSNAWYTNSVQSLASKGIVSGYQNGTFGPGNAVTRAELAVMLDRTIEYVQNGSVTQSVVSSGERSFDACGPLSAYKSNPWMPDLERKYAAGNHIEDTIGNGSEGCLSLDGSQFVFIPDDFASASKCGAIFSYDIVSNAQGYGSSTLTKIVGPAYCADTFHERVGNYIKFTGQSTAMSDLSCTKTDGKFFYLEDRVEVTRTSC